MSDIYQRLSELERRLANIIMLGTICDVDHDKALAQVKAGDMVTGWLPWLTRKAGGDVDYWAPEAGEQVIVLAPNGSIESGAILPALYQGATPAPSTNPKVKMVKFADGSTVEYDSEASTYTLNMVGEVKITTAKNVVVDGSMIKLNSGAGCITGESICHFTGAPHGDPSTKVFAGK